MTTSETETLRAAIEAALRRRDPEAEVTIASLSTPLGSVHYTASVMVLAARIAGDRSTERGALESLAVAAGLRVETCGSCGGRGQRLYAREVEDGCDACECAGVVVVDPAEEVARLTMALDDANNLASCQRDTIETLTRALHDAADRLGCADYDDACAAVADALDDAEKREREGVDEANALRMERASLRDDNTRLDDVARGALDDLARVRAELDAARLALARRDAEYLELARRSERRGFELRAAQVEAHTARRSLAMLAAVARRERDARAEWLDSLPGGSCGNPPPAALIDAETATGEVLRAIEAAEVSR